MSVCRPEVVHVHIPLYMYLYVELRTVTLALALLEPPLWAESKTLKDRGCMHYLWYRIVEE